MYDLSSGRLAGRGCMSLPYGRTSGQAEFEGLLAGLAAAHEAGVRNLAVQVTPEWFVACRHPQHPHPCLLTLCAFFPRVAAVRHTTTQAE
jgi:hypothetical protein